MCVNGMEGETRVLFTLHTSRSGEHPFELLMAAIRRTLGSSGFGGPFEKPLGCTDSLL